MKAFIILVALIQATYSIQTKKNSPRLSKASCGIVKTVDSSLECE